jgi:hypothetical protein
MRRFVGFGFGPIQAGLMLYEAQASGGFDDYVTPRSTPGSSRRSAPPAARSR